MFASTQPSVNSAPEILDGAQHSAPRSWNSLRQWSFRKGETNTAHHEQQRSNTASTVATLVNREPRRHDASISQRMSRTAAITALTHIVVLLAFSVPVIILALVVNVPQWYAFEADYWVSNAFTHCNYNGKFTPEDKPTLSLWDSAGFFYITVSWGKWAFSTAKFIDVVWDIVIGRGGQAFLALVTFKVSSQYLALAMRESPVSYNTFESLAFVPPSLVRTYRLAGDLLTNRGWKARLIIIWIVFSSLIVLGFSSLITAMSGYSSNIEAVMPDHDNESILWSEYMTVQFTIHDAQRIGHAGPLYVTTGEVCVKQGFLEDDDDDDGPYTRRLRRRDDDDDDSKPNDNPGNIDWEYVPANCTTFWRTLQYVSLYGLDGKNHSQSTITLKGVNHTIPSPSLNISTSYAPVSLSTLTTYLNTFSESSPPAEGSLSSVSDLTTFTTWLYENETYSFQYMVDNATCQYSKWHNWGFSFLFLFITSLLLAIWSVGTYALWLYTYLHSPQPLYPGQNTTGGIYRSSWTLVEAMKRDAGPGAVVSETNERDIRNLVRRRRGRVIYGVGNIDGHPSQYATETEKNIAVSPSTTSPTSQFPPTRWNEFRSWLSPSTRPRPEYMQTVQTPANSIFTHADSTLSSTSQHPILRSPAAPGRSMTMTSRLSSIASPFTDSPPEFGFAAATQADILNSPDQATSVSTPDPLSDFSTSGARTNRPRPRLSLSRAIRSSSYAGNNTPRATPLPSATSGTGKWVTSPSGTAPLTPSDESILTISPVREGPSDEVDIRDSNGLHWKNDLGDD